MSDFDATGYQSSGKPASDAPQAVGKLFKHASNLFKRFKH
jgi:hypothetical protein